MVLGELGDAHGSKQWRDTAAAGFDALVARHPLAFLDHAAEFWLGPGGNPRRAFALAKGNVANRKTPMSWTLLAKAAMDAGDGQAACRAATSAMAWRRPGRTLSARSDMAAAELVFNGCPPAPSGSTHSRGSDAE